MKTNHLLLVLLLATLLCSITAIPANAAPAGSPAPSGAITPENNPASKVNINSADIETLCTLKGIGPNLAQRIKEFREQHGPFKKVEDITEVRGVGETILEWNKNLMDIK